MPQPEENILLLNCPYSTYNETNLKWYLDKMEKCLTRKGTISQKLYSWNYYKVACNEQELFDVETER